MTKRNASRYPGIRSFERSEQHLFFGRARETQALYEAVKVKPLTVLFSQYGIGKTSLLNAGLVPMLEQNGYLPIVIRLQDTSISPVETKQFAKKIGDGIMINGSKHPVEFIVKDSQSNSNRASSVAQS